MSERRFWNSHVTPLVWNAVRDNNISFVKTLIENDCNVERGGFSTTQSVNNYSSPLIEAIRGGQQEMVKVLLRGKANVLPNIRDYTPLHMAVRKGLFEIVGTLLKTGKKCEAQLLARFTNDSPHGGNAAIHFALTSNLMDETNSSVSRFRTVKTLLHYGADVNMPDMDGILPIAIVDKRIRRKNGNIESMNLAREKSMAIREEEENGGHQFSTILDKERKDLGNLFEIRELLEYENYYNNS